MGTIFSNFLGLPLLTDHGTKMVERYVSHAAKGYVIELSGFASSDVGAYYNHELSAKRVEAVMDYLIGVGNVPIRRIVVPYSGGTMSPVADNNTRTGREQNRRVEVRMLVSKGLAAHERVAKTTN